MIDTQSGGAQKSPDRDVRDHSSGAQMSANPFPQSSGSVLPRKDDLMLSVQACREVAKPVLC